MIRLSLCERVNLDDADDFMGGLCPRAKPEFKNVKRTTSAMGRDVWERERQGWQAHDVQQAETKQWRSLISASHQGRMFQKWSVAYRLACTC